MALPNDRSTADHGRESGHDIIADAVRGLRSEPRWLPTELLYQGDGAAIFEEITALPEYYVARTETAVIESVAGAVVAEAAPDQIVELGSGSGRKTRLLLDAAAAAGGHMSYVPLDMSGGALEDTVAALRSEYPWLTVDPVVGNFMHDLRHVPAGGRRLTVMFGSTLGNFPQDERHDFLSRLRSTMTGTDSFLVGIDLLKETATLVAAYDDAGGVTARFNRNALVALGAKLGVVVDPTHLDHIARFDAETGCVQLLLAPRRPVVLPLPDGGSAVIDAGEEISTVISCKFTREGFAAELADAGLDLDRWWTDELGWYGLALARISS